MQTGLTNLPYTDFDKQIDHAGNREFYRMSYHEFEDLCKWDKAFTNKLDKYLITDTAVTKSEGRQIQEWLDYEDNAMQNLKLDSHELRVLESLDSLFLKTTKQMIQGMSKEAIYQF